jgi:hypothetical protein
MIKKNKTFSIILALTIFVCAPLITTCRQPRVSLQGVIDKDGDGLSDQEELKIGTDPSKKDTDSDGLTDFDEVKGTNGYITNPCEADTDSDGLSDREEVIGTNGYITNPCEADTDSDGLSDREEIWWACDPTRKDTDNDGFTDKNEIALKQGDHRKGDGCPYTEDTIKGKDKDKDSIPVGAEIYIFHTDPTIPSTDGDRYNDGLEILGFDFYSRESMPAYVKADPFSPATPDIMIELLPPVKLILKQDVKLGNKTLKAGEHEYRVDKGQETKIASESGVELSYDAKLGWPPWKSGGTAGLRAFQKVRFEASSTFYKQWSDRVLNTEEIYASREVDLSGSELQITLRIKNIGTDVLTSKLEQVTLNLYLGIDENPIITKKAKEIEYTHIRPGKDIIHTIQVPINFEFFKRFHLGEGVDVRVEHYSFGDDQKYLLNTESRCIRIDVCDGKNIERHFFSPKKEASFLKVCEEVGIDLQLSEKGSKLIGVNGKRNQIKKIPYSYWTVYFRSADGKGADSVENIQLKAGDIVILKYNIDSDGDMLSDIEELMLGTRKDAQDSDGDGLTDGFSCKELGLKGELSYFTNPLFKDSDFDLFSDGKEVEAGTNPNDEKDFPTYSSPIVSQTFPHQLSFKKDPLFLLDFENGDGLALGDINGDGKYEIIHADRGDWVRIYDRRGEILHKFEIGFEKGDALAVGDVNGDQVDEIVHGDRWDWIRIYNKDGTKLKQSRLSFDKGDRLAVGDLNGDRRAVIVHGNVGQGLGIYSNSEEPKVFEMDFERFDGLAVGDFNGDGKCEIVHADQNGWVRIYNISGEKLSEFNHSFEKGDALAVGDVNGDRVDEIVHVDQDGQIELLSKKDL